MARAWLSDGRPAIKHAADFPTLSGLVGATMLDKQDAAQARMQFYVVIVFIPITVVIGLLLGWGMPLNGAAVVLIGIYVVPIAALIAAAVWTWMRWHDPETGD